MLQLLVAQHHKTSAIRAKWQLSWIALSSHTSNLLRLFPNTTTGGAYPGLGVVRVFDLGFRGVWDNTLRFLVFEHWDETNGRFRVFEPVQTRTIGSGYLNGLITEQPLVRVFETLRSKQLPVLGFFKNSWVRVFEHAQSIGTVGSGY
jgi:hypothetical protein